MTHTIKFDPTTGNTQTVKSINDILRDRETVHLIQSPAVGASYWTVSPTDLEYDGILICLLEGDVSSSFFWDCLSSVGSRSAQTWAWA